MVVNMAKRHIRLRIVNSSEKFKIKTISEKILLFFTGLNLIYACVPKNFFKLTKF